MAYELHITRRRRWDGRGADITEAEWQDAASVDPRVASQLYWAGGIVNAKNPSPSTIDGMIVIAGRLRATVQGDDGEVYTSAEAPPTPYNPSLLEKVAAFVRRLRPVRPLGRAPLPPFGVGDSVTDVLHRPATVIAMDPTAEHGMGTITVRYKSGREATFMMRAHHLVPSASSEETERY